MNIGQKSRLTNVGRMATSSRRITYVLAGCLMLFLFDFFAMS